MKSTCYYNPYISSTYQPVFDEAANSSYLTMSENYEPYLFRYMNFLHCGQVDFTYDNASLWYQQQIMQSVALEFDGFMYDFAEYTPYDSISYTGQQGREIHNLYPVSYHKKYQLGNVEESNEVYFTTQCL
jgi:alpha-glucosidase (family GH31 glycosyl hydrolase)